MTDLRYAMAYDRHSKSIIMVTDKGSLGLIRSALAFAAENSDSEDVVKAAALLESEYGIMVSMMPK